MRARTPLLALAALAALMLPSSARAIGIEDVVDGGNTYPWVLVELPGTVCSDGSQYRFWYYDSPTSNNMVISYPSWANRFTLESAVAIPTNTWSAVTNISTVVSNELRVNVPVGPGNQFFRLRGQ